jgi:hypothetical protein
MWGWLRRRHRDEGDSHVPDDPQEARLEEARRRAREQLAREIEQTIERLQAEVDVLTDRRHRGHSR